MAVAEVLRVLHVIPSLAPVHGGTTSAVKAMASSVAGAGMNVDVACTDDDGPGARLSSLQQQQEGEVFRRWYFPKRSEFYKVSPAFARWIWRHAGDYDLVHVHALFSFTSVAAALVAWLRGVPYVISPHGSLTEYGVTRRRPLLKKMSMHIIEKPLLRRARAVHFTSAIERDEAAHVVSGHIPAIIPLGVEPAGKGCGEPIRADIGLPASSRVLVFLSRLDAKKNIEGLLRALALLAMERSDIHLVVAGIGEGAYVTSLKTLAQKLGVGSRVHWLGFVTGQRKADVLAAGDVFVLPSHSENFAIAAVEALAAGLPCILGEGVAISGTVASAGAGVAVSTEPAAIANAITELLADEKSRKLMGENARNLAGEAFSITKMGQAFAGMYKCVTASCRKRR